MPPLHSLCHPFNSLPSLPTSPSIPLPAPAPAPASNTLLPPPRPTEPPVLQASSSLPIPPPELDQSLPLQFKEKILCLEVLGVDSGRALSHNPALRTAPLHSIHSIISFLRSKGIPHRDLPRIVAVCPAVLTSSIPLHLSPVFRFLSEDLHVPEKDLWKPIRKCPKLLACSVRDQLRPVLAFLQGLGISDLRALAYGDPALLASSVEGSLTPKLDCLMSFGLGYGEVVEMVGRCPGLLTFSVERNLRPKFGYLVGEMGGGVEEVKSFPQYFGFSLEKRIVPRHKEMLQKGVRLPLPQMLKATDEEFRQLLVGSGDGQNQKTDSLSPAFETENLGQFSAT